MDNGKYKKELIQLYDEYVLIQNKIKSRLAGFKKIWKLGSDETIFHELVFCLLTPQSKAKNCGRAVDQLCGENLMLRGSQEDIKRVLRMTVRFHNNKSSYIIKARGQFCSPGVGSLKKTLGLIPDVFRKREWLVKNITGLGYKEASHFLRNIGFGDFLAILDRHILKNMKVLGIIDEIPGTISPKKYLILEDKLREYSLKSGIPLSHIDLLLWYRETGEIYK